MAYSDHFKLTDDLITHLDSVFAALKDPFIESRYTGFLSVSAATVFELAVKDIFRDFANRKHKVLAHFTDQYFDRISGRIRLEDLKDYVKKYGPSYEQRFKVKLIACDAAFLKSHSDSVKNCYSNVLNWRNEFAHGGRVPQHATYAEVKKSYELGKQVMHCLAQSMKR